MTSQLRHLLAIKPEQTVVFERFSDSAGGFITLDPKNPQVFKTLIRAAKAKLKLRLKATVTPLAQEEQPATSEAPAVPQPKAMEPVIVRSPVFEQPHSTPRDSKAFDRRSVGSAGANGGQRPDCNLIERRRFCRKAGESGHQRT